MKRWLGAVLTGGRSRRMGRDKAAVVVDGAPMRDHVEAALRAVCFDVVRVGGVDADIADDGSGPLVAVVELLRAHPVQHLVIAATDQPRLTTAALSALMAAVDGDDVVAFQDQPLPMAVGIGALPRLQRLVDGGERRLRAAVTTWVPLTDEMREATVDVDTPEDLASLPPRRR